MTDTSAKAAELIRLRRAVDAGGGTVDLNAHHKWSRHSYLYSDEIAQALLTEAAARQKMEQALRAIDRINDHPGRFNTEIDQAIKGALSERG